MPFPRMWVICEKVVKVLWLIVYSCVLNQSLAHYLLTHALQFIISTCQNVHEELAFQPIHYSLVEEDVFDYELKKLMV
jgi:hypothetical protein